MDSSLTTYITLVSVSGVLNLFLCMYAYYRRKHIRGSYLFILYTLAIAIYCFSYAIGLTSSTLEQVLFWTTIQYIGMPAASPLGLLIVMQFLGQHWSRKTTLSLFVIPLISFLLVATNDYHHLFYKSITVKPGMTPPFIDIEIGLWYVVHGIFTFSCMLYTFIRLLIRWKETLAAYRFQLAVLILGQLVPMTTAFLYLIGATPAGIDPVPFVLWITSGLYIWAILSSNMLSLIPIAKETLFHNMKEGVIVLDARERLIDFNSAAKKIFPALNHTLIGQTFDQIRKQLTSATFPLSLQQEHGLIDFSLRTGDHAAHYQARTSFLYNQNNSIAGRLIMMIDVTELKQLQQELERQAYYDGLTQIYNRTQFFKLAAEQLQRAQQRNEPYSLIIFDIDHFKKVNDTFGHDVGDQLLVHVVQRCKQTLPVQALFARYGGEEFVISLSGYNTEHAFQLANMLRKKLADQPLQIEEQTWPISASFGLAKLNPVQPETLQQLLIHADQALYKAKRNGRNQVMPHQAQ